MHLYPYIRIHLHFDIRGRHLNLRPSIGIPAKGQGCIEIRIRLQGPRQCSIHIGVRGELYRPRNRAPPVRIHRKDSTKVWYGRLQSCLYSARSEYITSEDGTGYRDEQYTRIPVYDRISHVRSYWMTRSRTHHNGSLKILLLTKPNPLSSC